MKNTFITDPAEDANVMKWISLQGSFYIF